jgi:hypothetical protein
MMALWNHERFGDWRGARDELALRLRRFGAQYSPAQRRMLEFRLALIDEKLGGPDPLSAYLTDADSAVRTAAEMLRRQRESGAALAVFYANMPARLFVDGREVMQAGHPERPVVAALDLSPGRHVLAIQSPRHPYPDWIQLSLAGRDWFAGTDTSWRFAFNPSGDWAAPDYEDSAWLVLAATSGMKGPPEEPFLWVEPDPFLGMQSRAIAIRPTGDWPNTATTVVFRQVITVP